VGGQERHDAAGYQLWLLGGATWPPLDSRRQQRMLNMRSGATA